MDRAGQGDLASTNLLGAFLSDYFGGYIWLLGLAMIDPSEMFIL